MISIRCFIPEPCKKLLRKMRQGLYAVAYVRAPSESAHFCPVCEKGLVRFRKLSYGDTKCFICGSDERHRLVWLFLHRLTNLFDGSSRTMLHVAPEIQFENGLRAAVGPSYITADLLDPRAKVKMDITNIQYPDSFFDVIYCSHVLEHIPNDRLAMREFVRVLKPSGWAVIMVPCYPDRGKTFEDPSVTDPKERLRLFGQEDHVRIYGNDFIDRLNAAGFDVRVIRSSDFLSPAEIARFNLTTHSGDVFLCTKR